MRPHRSPIPYGIMGGWPPARRHDIPPRPVSEAPLARYVELHCHSAFSLHEGTSRPEELVATAVARGYQALALTDHDSLAGAMLFAQAGKEFELQAIIGAEITLESGAHLTLLSETPRGYANLSRLLSRANLSSPRGEPRVHWNWLPEFAEGLIALSGCRRGEVAALAEHGDVRDAIEVAARYRDIFGLQSYFIELQDNLIYEDQSRNEALVAVAAELGLGIVGTNNVHSVSYTHLTLPTKA